MLKHFMERTKGEQEPALVHRGGVFEVGLLPVAKLERFHISRFLKAVHQYHDENVDTIYVLARGMNVILAKHVISEIEKSNLYVKNKDWEYTIVGRVKRRLNAYIGELSRV